SRHGGGRGSFPTFIRPWLRLGAARLRADERHLFIGRAPGPGGTPMLTGDRLRSLVEGGETFEVEFKGEEKGPLSDEKLVEAVVCLANGAGGTLLVGVEDDGRVTGARARHKTSTDPRRVEALLSNKTRPSVGARAE